MTYDHPLMFRVGDSLDAMTLAHSTAVNELQTSQQNLVERDAEIDRLRRELRAQRDAMLDEKLTQDDRIASLTARVTRKEDEYKSLMHTHLTTQAETRQQISTLQTTLNHTNTRMSTLQTRMSQLDGELREAQTEVMERRHASKKGQDDVDERWKQMVQTLKVSTGCMDGWMDG